MAQYYSRANLTHTLAHIATKSRPIYVQVEFEVFGSIHGESGLICTSLFEKSSIYNTNIGQHFQSQQQV